MYSFLKKLLSALLVLYLVALVLNLKVGGTPTREWTNRAWHSEGVQKVYRTVRDRVMALIRKDISVEEVFQSEPQPAVKPSPGTTAQKPKEEVRTIDFEKLSEKDREALEKILDKASQ